MRALMSTLQRQLRIVWKNRLDLLCAPKRGATIRGKSPSRGRLVRWASRRPRWSTQRRSGGEGGRRKRAIPRFEKSQRAFFSCRKCCEIIWCCAKLRVAGCGGLTEAPSVRDLPATRRAECDIKTTRLTAARRVPAAELEEPSRPPFPAQFCAPQRASSAASAGAVI